MTPNETKMMHVAGPQALLTEAESLQLKQCLGEGPDETTRLTAGLAQKMLDMNDRVRVLLKHSLREKITAFLELYKEENGCGFSVPLSREEMAEYLGCDRSALSRELARMSGDGIIEYNRNSFKVLK
ncbi:MAG: Crp/Fnr family transcriptional regulator [Clostridia bacterium]|nr:Crp/Fnr family transcriptional regulator [Clostridia bacterium]